MLLRIQKNDHLGGITEEIVEGDILYAGPILREAQIKALKTYGNTVISKQLYDLVSEDKLKSEIRRLTDLAVKFEVKELEDGDRVVLVKLSKKGGKD